VDVGSVTETAVWCKTQSHVAQEPGGLGAREPTAIGETQLVSEGIGRARIAFRYVDAEEAVIPADEAIEETVVAAVEGPAGEDEGSWAEVLGHAQAKPQEFGIEEVHRVLDEDVQLDSIGVLER
jgi:hypothetical protein